ncbi:MAG: RidA family protein [Bacteroidota bacterium]
MKEIIHSEKAPAPIGPYSQAVKAANTLYISGQIPIDQETGKLVDSSIEDETEQVMKNIRNILEEAGLGFGNVVKCSIFVSDMDNFSRVNAIYGKYFQRNPPARETIEVGGLPKNVNIEVSCIAVF